MASGVWMAPLARETLTEALVKLDTNELVGQVQDVRSLNKRCVGVKCFQILVVNVCYRWQVRAGLKEQEVPAKRGREGRGVMRGQS